MISRRSLLKIGMAAPVMGLAQVGRLAAAPEIFSTNGVAISGYDPVAYFKRGEPVDGSDTHALRWMGSTWRFSSAENMADFEANPHAFEPQYGGYCAFAMSKGAIANTVPEAWTIFEDKLYLNFSTGVRTIWRGDMPGNIELANGFWPDILNA